MPTFTALKKLGGSGSNDEILDQIILDLELSDDQVDYPHKGNPNISELQYQLAWSRTYLKKYGVIENSTRSVWSILPDYVSVVKLDEQEIVSAIVKDNAKKRKEKTSNVKVDAPEDEIFEDSEIELPDEVKPWRTKLAEILQNMNPYGFERLSQRLLRECGFAHVEVTKKSGDGGIDGHGKWKINGIFSFNVAFQCKRYSNIVSAGDIRDFRGSLTTDIEKGIFITTGTFSKAAKEEASKPGKQQIDLIDGDELIEKIAQYGIGVKEVKSYEIDEDYFDKI
jgi:restriction system protein